MSNSKSIYLPGLNGIRAIAAMGVMISHINLSLKGYGIKNFSLFGFRNGTQSSWALGEQGVTMFFVLSGFLITYLLIKEKRKTNTVSLKKFYLRRILRIWPLYFFYFFLTLIIGFVANNFFPSLGTIALYIFFLANIPFLLNQVAFSVGHFWSIAVEEQFYLFWPTFFKMKERTLEIVLWILIPVMILIRILLWKYFPFRFFTELFTVNRFDCMMFGGLMAIIISKKSILNKIIRHKVLQFISWLILVVSFLNLEIGNSIIQLELITFATGIIICEQISSANPIINLENKVLNFLGKYSFGIYVYHPLIMWFVFKSGLLQQIKNETIKSLLIFVSIIILTIIIATISYEYFEKKFIIRKEKYSVIHSSNEKLA